MDCFSADISGSLILGKVKAKSAFLPSGAGIGKLTIRGFLDVHPPADSFLPNLEQGLDPNSDPPGEIVLLIHAFDGATLSEVISFTREDCEVVIREGFLNRVRCRNPENTRKAFLKRHPLVPDLFKFAVKAKRLSLDPFTMNLVTVNLKTGVQNRPDDIGSILPCEIKTAKLSRILCDEPTGF
jgi:hypothetical protein